MIKLIAIDLDGTLLNDAKEVDPESIRAIHSAQKQGVKVVLCTGRPYLAMKNLVAKIGFSDEDYIAVFNGGQIRKAQSGELVYRNDLSREDMLAWVQECQRLNLPLNVIDDEWVYEPLSYPKDYPSQYVKKLTTAPSKQVDFESFGPDQVFNKFVINVDADHLDRQLKIIRQEMVGEYSLSRSYPFQLEIMARGVHKGLALIQLGQLLSIDLADMVGIGDQGNDLPLLETAGHPVAMGNAIPKVKDLAEYVTTTNNKAGVAQAIDYYLNLQAK